MMLPQRYVCTLSSLYVNFIETSTEPEVSLRQTCLLFGFCGCDNKVKGATVCGLIDILLSIFQHFIRPFCL